MYLSFCFHLAVLTLPLLSSFCFESDFESVQIYQILKAQKAEEEKNHFLRDFFESLRLLIAWLLQDCAYIILQLFIRVGCRQDIKYGGTQVLFTHPQVGVLPRKILGDLPL